MVPAGYLFKRVAASPPDWGRVQSVCSVSGCISENFADYIEFWKHNGYWLFDSPAIIEDVAAQHAIDLSGATPFYYEVYESEFDEKTRQWTPFTPDAALATNIVVPEEKELLGFDVVTFSVRTAPECSPLSCNGLAKEVPVNRHCLFDTFEVAKEALEDGAFDHSEPGPFRVIAVYRVSWGGPGLV